MTLHDPDASLASDEAFLGKLSATKKGRKVGRPRGKEPGYRKARRDEFMHRAWELWGEGKSNAEIAHRVSRDCGFTITAMSIGRWLKPRGKP